MTDPDWEGFFDGLICFVLTVAFVLWVFGVFK